MVFKCVSNICFVSGAVPGALEAVVYQTDTILCCMLGRTDMRNKSRCGECCKEGGQDAMGPYTGGLACFGDRTWDWRVEMMWNGHMWVMGENLRAH